MEEFNEPVKLLSWWRGAIYPNSGSIVLFCYGHATIACCSGESWGCGSTMASLQLTVLLLVACTTAAAPVLPRMPRVVAAYLGYKPATYPAKDIDFGIVTHLVLGDGQGLIIDPNGTVPPQNCTNRSVLRPCFSSPAGPYQRVPRPSPPPSPRLICLAYLEGGIRSSTKRSGWPKPRGEKSR